MRKIFTVAALLFLFTASFGQKQHNVWYFGYGAGVSFNSGVPVFVPGGQTATTEGVFAAAHPERFLQMGAAEQNMVGVAAGLATMGFVPFVTSYACFQVFRAHDQVRVLLAQTGEHDVRGKADPEQPAACSNNTYVATLDGTGKAKTYTPVGDTQIPG